MHVQKYCLGPTMKHKNCIYHQLFSIRHYCYQCVGQSQLHSTIERSSACWLDNQHQTQCNWQTECSCRQTMAAAAAAGKQVKNNDPTTRVLHQTSAASKWSVERDVVGHLMTIRQSLSVPYQYLPSFLYTQPHRNDCQVIIPNCQQKHQQTMLTTGLETTCDTET